MEEAKKTTETTETSTGADIIDRIAETVEALPARSAWARGVKAYAAELLDSLRDAAAYAAVTGAPSPLADRKTVRAALLNGAEDWSQYSWGGCSLIYNGDIAELLCTPSELKRKRGGELPPNAAEDWLDVQARALYQASVKVLQAYDLALDAIREGARK